jgi:hypothetical protein
MNRRLTLLVILLLCTITFAQSDSPSTKPSDDSGPWHKVKSDDGTARGTPRTVKFKVATRRWRVRMNTSEDTSEGPGANATIRVALMTETMRDIDDKPVNWTQVAVLCDGKAGASGTKVFDNGLDKSGKPKWFQLVITGHRAEYDVVVEDQSSDDAAKGAKKKKKKSDDD